MGTVTTLHKDVSPNFVHVMVDTETLGLDPNSIVLSLGAVSFTFDGLGTEYYTAIDPKTYPGAVDLETIKWWMDQSFRGNKAPMDGVVPAQMALMQFESYLAELKKDGGKIILWANGTDFDIPKLYYAYKVFGMNPSWKYSDVRDCRTLFKTFPDYGNETSGESIHNALADARWQADRLVSILKNLDDNGIIFGEF